jgi:hypothetical protein
MTWLRRLLAETPTAPAADPIDDFQAAWRLLDLMRRLRPGEQRFLLAEAERLVADRDEGTPVGARPRRAH